MAAAASAQTTYTSTDVPKPIPPGAPSTTSGTTTSTLTVPSGGTIGDVTVSVDLQHTYIGDLLISITSPGGTSVRLLDGGGVGNANDISSSAPPYVFSDAHASTATGSDSNGGNFKPIDNLSNFDSENPSGQWTLTVQDRLGGDVGQLNSWSVTISTDLTLTVTNPGGGNGTVTGAPPSTIGCTFTAGAGSPTCSESVADGTSVVLNATPSADSVFSGWVDCDTKNDLQCTQTVSGNETVGARFELRRDFSVSGNGAGRGNIADSSNGISCDWDGAGGLSGSCSAGIGDGTTFNLTATPGVNSAFTGWTGCDTVGSNPNECTQVVSGGDESVTASFVRTAYAISVTASPAAGGTVSGGGNHPPGSTVIVVATANPGHIFVNWTENGSQVSANASYSFTANADRTLVANFATAASPENDLLVDFGKNGLWQLLNNTAWLKVHANNAFAVGAGDLDGSGKDEALATIYGFGLAARYNNVNPLRTLQHTFARFFVVGDFDGNGKEDVAADLAGSGVWVLRNNSTPWVRLQHTPTQGLAVGDLNGDGKDELLADRGTTGLWASYNNGATWTRLHPTSPVYVATGDLDGDGKGEVIVDPGSGVFARFNNAGGFVRLLGAGSQGIVTGDLNGDGKDELIVDRGAAGLWAHSNGGTWRKLNPGNANLVIATDLDRSGKEDVVAGFGASGLFVLLNDGAVWRKLHGWPVEGLAAGSFD